MQIINAFRIAECIVVQYDSHIMTTTQKFAKKHHKLICENFPILTKGLTPQHDRRLLTNFLSDRITFNDLIHHLNK